MIDQQQLADVIKGGITATSPVETVSRFLNVAMSVASDLGLTYLIDSGLTSAQAANIVRDKIVGAIRRGSEVAVIGASRGYVLPDDPVPRFSQINSRRQLFAPTGLTAAEGSLLVQSAIDLIRVGIGYDDGSLTFDRSQPASQMSSFEVSVDGMASQSGNALADILGYQPDADFVKRKRALDSLSRLDFSKRKPYLLFTADVIRDGRRRDGTIVCWMRMRDAAGYNIAKRDVFGIIDFPEIALTNAGLEATTAELLADHEFQQVLSFYDWVHPGDVYAFMDSDTHSDTLYSYVVTGVQRRAPASPYIFDGATNSLYLTAAQMESVKGLVGQDFSQTERSSDIDSVSPYPALAQVIYGDSGYGWILAGYNVLASQRRGESNEQLRSFSYVGSKASEVLAAVTAGRVVVPTDISAVHAAVDSSIASYGVSQTLLAILDGIGLTMFVAGKDDPLGFRPTQESLEQATGGLAKIIAAIDPQTASVDPRALSAALSVHGSSADGPKYTATQIQTKSSSGPSRTATKGQTKQAPPSLDQIIGDDVIDLTTYDGLARLMQLLRAIYDFYPGSLS